MCDGAPSIRPQQTLERIEQRQIGAASRQALRAAPAGDVRNPSTRDDLAQQVFDQGRLAAARLAGDAHHQTAPGDGSAESFAQCRPLLLVADGAPAPAGRDGQTQVIAAHALRCSRLMLQPIQHSGDGGFW